MEKVYSLYRIQKLFLTIFFFFGLTVLTTELTRSELEFGK